MIDKKWSQWRHPVESGGIHYPSASALVETLRRAYVSDAPTREAFDAMAWGVELTAKGVGGFEATLVYIPIADVRR